MSLAPRESAIRAVATQLDRAITDTARRWPIVIPFILSDALVALQYVAINSFVMWGLSILIENCIFVIVIEMLATGNRIDWMAVFRYPRALWFVLVGPLFDVPLSLLVLGVVTPFAVVQSGRLLPYGVFGEVIGMTVVIVLCCLICVVAAPFALLILAALAALIDTVVRGDTARAAFGAWLRRCFRPRTIVSSLLAGSIFLLLFTGVTILTSLIPTPNRWVHALVNGIPDGIADATAFTYLWHWRLWRLNLDRGHDLAAQLPATG